MSDNFFKVRNGISLGNLSADPSNPVNGDLYYNTTTNKFRKYQNSAWSDMDTTGTGSTGFRFDEQAYCNSDGSGTELNCSTSVVSGKLRVTLSGWTYTTGQLSGTPSGNIEVYLDGKKIDRFVSGLTLGTYYTEISSSVIEFDDDYSSATLSIQIYKVTVV